MTFTTLYPAASQPHHGVFVENRLRHLVKTGKVQAQVIAPVPWFPARHAVFGKYGRMAQAPDHEIRHGIAITHPRYLVLPKIGMTTAPVSLFASTYALSCQRRGNIDLIDAHYFYPDGVAAVMLGRAIGKPVVITARGTDINLIPRYPLPRQMIVRAAHRAAAVIAVSQALKDALIELGVDSERVTVLRNGVDLEQFRPGDRQRVRMEMQIAGPTLLSVGHLIERKGHDLVIKALPLLPEFRLLIAGEGVEIRALRLLARRLGVSERVKFLGAVPHEELRNVYVASDALILASSREGWPNVLLEAMACGTPVVATAIWGTPEVVSGPEAGILIRDRTPEAIAAGVKNLFSLPPPRDATRKFAERFSWDATSAGQIKLFERVLAKREPWTPDA